MTTYLDVLAELGIDSAHPGGLLLTKNILRQLHITPATRILDVGCGTGQTAAYIAETYGANVTAIDIHPKMLEKAKARFSSLAHPVALRQASIESLPFSHEQFDIILCESVLSFVALPKALKEIYRALKRRGTLVGIEASHLRLLEDEKKEIVSFYEFQQLLTPEQWRLTLTGHGFRDVQMAAYTAIESPAAATPFTLHSIASPDVLVILQQHETLRRQYGNDLGYCIFSCQK